ncbi:MAG TPA: phage terminase large subunit [Solirubrobacterales bacterium]|jgi:predicted phage terminase large subunit-like protein
MGSSVPLPTLARASPAGLAIAVDERLADQGAVRRYAFPPHIRLIDREIMEAVARAHERQRRAAAGKEVDDRPEILLIELGPRHGKSTEVSEYTPAWFIGTFPERHVILCSYEADFASSWGLKARSLLEEHGPDLYGVKLDASSRAAKRWGLEGHRGGMVTAGVGGPITGKGAHLLIIDDPIKNAEQAMSEVIREKHWEWWLSTARTRLEPGAVVIVLLTRWHQDDIAGRMLAASDDGGDPVREIRLPALALDDDPLGREPGEALWPERYSADWLEHTRKVLGPYWFTAMYQGSPTPDEGGIFARKYFHYFTIDGDLVTLHRPGGEVESFGLDYCRKVQYVDLAASEKQTADYTVMTEVWVTPKRDLLVRNVIRDRIAGPEQPEFFEDHHAGGAVKVESIGYQSTLIQEMLRRGFPAEPVFPDKDKVTRASAAGALYRGGKVYHLRGAEWLGDLEAEMLAFPAGEHDDQVDTIAYAARDLPNVEIAEPRRQRERGSTIAGGLASAPL